MKLIFSLILAGSYSLLLAAGSSSKRETESTPQSIKNYNEGVAAQKNKNYEEAIQYYQQALSQKSDFPEAWNNLGYCYRMIAKSYLSKAGNAYDKALRLQPAHEEALEYQGEYFIMTGQLSYAYRNYQKLREMKSKEASELQDKLDAVLKQAQSILKDYQP